MAASGEIPMAAYGELSMAAVTRGGARNGRRPGPTPPRLRGPRRPRYHSQGEGQSARDCPVGDKAAVSDGRVRVACYVPARSAGGCPTRALVVMNARVPALEDRWRTSAAAIRSTESARCVCTPVLGLRLKVGTSAG